MARILSFCNRKGGSGKTTTAVHVAGGLGLLGKRVLLIDCDPQAHASLWLLDQEKNSNGLLDCLYGKVEVKDAISPTGYKGLYILPGNRALSEFEADFSREKGAAFLLKRCLKECQSHFDYIIFDTPPYIGLLLVSCLTACQYVYITVPLQFLALDGLFEIKRLMERIREKANPKLELKGIIPVMFNRNLKSSWQFLKEIKKVFGRDLLFPFVRQNVRLSEAPGEKVLIYEYAPKSNGTIDYWALTKAIQKDLTKEESDSNYFFTNFKERLSSNAPL